MLEIVLVVLLFTSVKGHLLESILDLAANSGPVTSVTVLSKSNGPDLVIGKVPVFQFNTGSPSISDIQQLKESSKICPLFIIIQDEINDVENVIESFQPGLKQGSGARYILILKEQVFNKDVETSVLRNDGFFSKVLHLVIVVNDVSRPRRKLVFERDPNDESKVSVNNIWNGESFEHPRKELFSNNRLTNFKKQQLTVTSFEYVPFYYQSDDGSRGGSEVNM